MDALWLQIVQWLHTVGLHIDSGTAQAVAEGAARATQQLDMPGLLALAAALGWASGMRLYAVVFLVGGMGALGWIALPPALTVLQHPMVLMANDLSKIPYAISMARHARRVVFQNLAFAMSVILVLLVSALVFQLQLPLGVVGHEGSTVLVCLNGLRLLAYRNSFSAVVAAPLAALV